MINDLHTYLHIQLRKRHLKDCFIYLFIGKWEGKKPNFHFNENTHPITPSKSLLQPSLYHSFTKSLKINKAFNNR